ncbi:hypothetical protein DFP72DRAFT_1064515 [Ephemerocybe angulata]|uniref:Uncharacterized protein n=1 Tax=Ephemerocybe angulata TaxID=980116 RepID=A0A8H6MBG5_9AGAR|nr:hypothetical protein DFP72DRAFT_1064515 [Tulosesus angulatus]
MIDRCARVSLASEVNSLNDSFKCNLNPENVLVCIDDVESVIGAELASLLLRRGLPDAAHWHPAHQGRGGNQTPRSESVFITGEPALDGGAAEGGKEGVWRE